MKKIWIILFLSLTILTGCSNNNKNLNYDDVYNNLNNEFSNFIKLDSDTLEGNYGIDLSNFESYMVVQNSDGTSSKMYAIFKLGEDKTESSDEVSYFKTQYEKSWLNGYFPEEEKLVKNGEIFEYGDYLIYIVSNDPESTFNNIKEG